MKATHKFYRMAGYVKGKDIEGLHRFAMKAEAERMGFSQKDLLNFARKTDKVNEKFDNLDAQ